MTEFPSALLRISRLPDGLICLLQQLAEGGRDPVKTTLDIVERDPDWLRDVTSMLAQTSLTPEGDWVPAFEGRTLPDIAIATAVRRYVRNGIVSAEMSRYWQYSLACAVACAELARCTPLQPYLAFSCGLLHDLGRLALMTAYPAQYANLFATSARLFGRNELINVSEQERLLFGFDRFQTGEWLTGQWQLPEFLRQIVGKFQPAQVSACTNLISLTRTGCSVVHSLGYGLMLGAPRRSIESLKSAMPSPVLVRFGADLRGLKKIIDETLENWPESPVGIQPGDLALQPQSGLAA